MTDPASQKRPAVPDLDSLVVGGQRLTRVRRRTRPEVEIQPDEPEDPPPPALTLEELARKHLGADPEATLEEHGAFLSALQEPEDESGASPPMADLAKRMELFSDTGAIPNPETNPQKREDGALSPIVTTEDAPDFMAGKAPPETIFDLFQMFPQLDGVNWWIYVVRKAPNLFGGINISGVLRPISRPLTLSEWAQLYGGGTYELIVYGPPKFGVVLDANGRVPAKKLTQPITFKFPGTPSLESMVYDDDDQETESSMTQPVHDVLSPSRRPLSMGDAKVAEKSLDVAAAREVRGETREDLARKEAQALRDRESKQSEGLVGQLLQSQRESAARQDDLLREMMDNERKHAEQLRLADEKWEERIKQIMGEQQKPDDVERLLKLSTGMNKGGDADALRAEHAREIKQMVDQRQRDSERHDQLLKDERGRSDQAIRDAQERADRRIKDAEERFSNNERDARERAAVEVQRAKDEAERRVNDQHRQNETRIADLDRQHSRDLDSLKAAHTMTLESMKNTFEMRFDSLKGDAKRAQTEADRAKIEAEEYKDLPKQISKLRSAAADLGMTDASENEPPEPETVGQTLLKVAGNLAGSLPQVVESLGGMLGKRSTADLDAARMQGRQDMIQQAGGGAFGPGAGFGQPAAIAPTPRVNRPRRLQPIEQAAPPPLVPGHEPFRPQQTRQGAAIPSDQPEEQMRQEFLARSQELQQSQPTAFVPIPEDGAQYAAEQPQQQAMAMAPQSVPPPPPSMPPPAPPALAAPQQQDPAQAAEDAQLLEAEGLLLNYQQSGSTPADVAAAILGAYPKELVGQLLSQLGSAERMLDAYARQRPPDHAFNRYSGKKFIRGLFQELTKAASV